MKMARYLTSCVLLVLSTLVGCGGGDRMTVDEYAVACGALLDTFDGSLPEDSSGFLFVEGVYLEMEEWKEPQELKEFHSAMIMSLESSLEAMHAGFGEPMNKLLSKGLGVRRPQVQSEAAAGAEERVRASAVLKLRASASRTAVELLSPSTRATLEETDCLSPS